MIDVLAWLALLVGGLVSTLNFYLSFCRYALHRIRGGSRESYRWVSGFPFVGSLLVALSIFRFYDAPWILAISLVLIAIDTGGIHWFVGVLIYQNYWQKRVGKPLTAADGPPAPRPFKSRLRPAAEHHVKQMENNPLSGHSDPKNEPGMWTALLSLVVGVYLVLGAVVAFASGTWPTFLAPQLNLIAFLLGAFVGPVSVYISAVVPLLIGLLCCCWAAYALYRRLFA